MPRITKLKLLNGETRGEWSHAKATIETTCNIWTDARREIAEWADCPLSSVGTVENDWGGEFITVDDEPVAFLESTNVPDVRSRSTVVDLRAIMMAAE